MKILTLYGIFKTIKIIIVSISAAIRNPLLSHALPTKFPAGN